VCWSLTAARESESLRSSSRSSRRSDVRSATPGKTAQGEDKTRSDVRSSTPGKTAQDEDKTRPALASAGRRWPFLAELAPRTGASATTRPGTCLDRSGPCFVRRRGRDSNPGYACAHTGFRDQHNRPLCHLSEGGSSSGESYSAVAIVSRWLRPFCGPASFSISQAPGAPDCIELPHLSHSDLVKKTMS
jgi:hypothetical protein